LKIFAGSDEFEASDMFILHKMEKTIDFTACSFGWWLMAGADLY
jgi:hypothetical protein